MSIEVLPLGTRCNLKCGTPTAVYCYQEPIRTAGNEGHPRYDMDAMKAALQSEGYKFTVFGGEPLLMPIDDLGELFRWGREQFGAAAEANGENPNGIQTNGTLMTDDHIRLFRRHRVGVGLSIDGPEELNDARWAGTFEATRAATARSQWAIEQLLEKKMQVSLIVTLHRFNASPDRLPRLLDWFRALSAKGLRHVNLHLLEVDDPAVRNELSLTDADNVSALMACARLMSEIAIEFKPLTDMVRLLRGEDQWGERPNGGFSSGTSCTWNACDPYTTNAVHGVDGAGGRGNCGRTCKEGPFWSKASTAGYERYLSLGLTPQAYGGCQGCRFFFACKGHCPGEGLGGDWRAKTEHCAVLFRIFELLEADLVRAGETPLSLADDRAAVERVLMTEWQHGRTISVRRARALVASPLQISPTAPSSAPANVPHGDAPHGDAPHGDHTDTARPVHSHGDHEDNAGRVDWASL